jgi:hypothetical protein
VFTIAILSTQFEVLTQPYLKLKDYCGARSQLLPPCGTLITHPSTLPSNSDWAKVKSYISTPSERSAVTKFKTRINIVRQPEKISRGIKSANSNRPRAENNRMSLDSLPPRKADLEGLQLSKPKCSFLHRSKAPVDDPP